MTQLETGADEDTSSSYAPGEFAHETGLSNPGLAAEQDDRGARQRRIEDLEEAFELILAADDVAEVIRPGMSASIPVGMPKALTADSITR